MAITAPITLGGFSGYLTPDQSAPIFDDAQRRSAFQQLFRRIPLGISGQSIPVITSKPTANWVAEGAKKPATQMGLGLLNMVPQKIAAIAVLSKETVRANPGNINGLLRQSLGEAFAVAFDYAVGYDLGGDGTGTGPFAQNLAGTSKSVEIGTTTKANGGFHGDLVAAMSLLLADGRKLTGWALDDNIEPLLWGAVDLNGLPLYVDLPTDNTSQGLARPGRLLNRPSFMGDGVGVGTNLGFAGDFTKGAWGAVGGINWSVSTESTVTINGQLVSLWENNLVGVLAEAEYGFVLQDDENFVKLANATP